MIADHVDTLLELRSDKQTDVERALYRAVEIWPSLPSICLFVCQVLYCYCYIVPPMRIKIIIIWSLLPGVKKKNNNNNNNNNNILLGSAFHSKITRWQLTAWAYRSRSTILQMDIYPDKRFILLMIQTLLEAKARYIISSSSSKMRWWFIYSIGASKRG